MPDLVRNSGFGQFLFCFAQRTDFRAGVDACRDVGHAEIFTLGVAQVPRRKPSLNVRSTGEGWRTDDVAHGVDIGGRCLKIRIHGNLASMIGFNSEVFETQ